MIYFSKKLTQASPPDLWAAEINKLKTELIEAQWQKMNIQDRAQIRWCCALDLEIIVNPLSNDKFTSYLEANIKEAFQLASSDYLYTLVHGICGQVKIEDVNSGRNKSWWSKEKCVIETIEGSHYKTFFWI